MHDAITDLSSNQWREQNLMACRMLAGVNGRLKGKYFERFAKEYQIPCHISEQTRKNTFAFYRTHLGSMMKSCRLGFFT